MAAIISGLLSLLFAALAAWSFLRTRRFLATAHAARGTVVDLEERDDVWLPVVAFKDGDGKRYEFTNSVGSSPARYREGDRVEVLYDPARPERARIQGFFSLWLLPLVLVVFAGTWFLIAVACLIALALR